MIDARLIPEFSGAATDMPIVEWVENVELVCELCTMKNAKRVLPLRLQRGALAIGNLARSRKRMQNRSGRPSQPHMLLMHLMYITSLSLNNFTQMRRWTSFLLSCNNRPVWLGVRCPNVA